MRRPRAVVPLQLLIQLHNHLRGHRLSAVGVGAQALQVLLITTSVAMDPGPRPFWLHLSCQHPWRKQMELHRAPRQRHRGIPLPGVIGGIQQVSSQTQTTHIVGPSTTLTTRDSLHPNWYIRAIIYMVAFLHIKHRVTFRACGLILVCLAFIFSCTAGDLVATAPVLRTLTTIFVRLDIRDAFIVHPICFKCYRIFPPKISPLTFCPDCTVEIFGGSDRDDSVPWDDMISDSEAAESSTGAKKRKPQVVVPIQLLSAALQGFFNCVGMVSTVTSWKKRPPNSNPSELKSIQDGRVWRTMKGQDGDSFFYGASGDEEIRLGVSFSFDWFGRSKSSFGPSHSSGLCPFVYKI
ncbi:hypothetical protein MVEN_01438400 [Mycena venus]|uniref:Uncharacterized protein n=1 Tax=Mycena venus TaxID=2733690 RepID=A0A8H6XZC2_9AGAR|nr:hypothetical protein MVEN_01438400 [Mycena venus]